MTFLSSKEPRFEETTSSNDKAKVFFKENEDRKIFGIFLSASRVDPFGKRQIFQL